MNNLTIEQRHRLERLERRKEKARARRAFMTIVRQLEDHPNRLQDAWFLYREARRNAELYKFIEIVNNVMDDEVVTGCCQCRQPTWEDETDVDINGNVVCSDCRRNYTECQSCDGWSIRSSYIYWVAGNHYCLDCRNDACSFCDECDDWYLDINAEDHEHEAEYCECAPYEDLRFKILANSHGVLNQDERLRVELPQGFITEEAIQAILSLIWQQQFSELWNQHCTNIYSNPGAKMPEGLVEYDDLRRVVESLERTWQAKRGNFPRRLSTALYKELGVKLQTPLLSSVGSTARAHAPKTNEWHIEFTRDLNQPASHFFHGGSCWWQSENGSLCSFKHWGGVGMRSYARPDQERRFPSGRAWVQPLNEELRPTLDVYGAHAYVVYNGYGELDGYTPARLVAYLTSKTYKKIEFSADRQYVNCGGYLISDQETCDNTSEINLSQRSHHERIPA